MKGKYLFLCVNLSCDFVCENIVYWFKEKVNTME